jgi:hypothetical protein
LIQNELKKLCISSLTTHNFSAFGSIGQDSLGIPEISDFAKAQIQGQYMYFIEQAFEWENLQYELYPYYWARKSTWHDRLTASFQSVDPSFADFIRSGTARVSLPARLGFSMEVLYFLQSGNPWTTGPISGLTSKYYQSLALEMEEADKADAQEVAVGGPIYTVVPTELVTLRADSNLPMWDYDPTKNIWTEVTKRVDAKVVAKKQRNPDFEEDNEEDGEGEENDDDDDDDDDRDAG